MYSSFVRRQVRIGDAAAFVGTTPRAIRHYHDIGLLPEPERGTDDRRRYGYQQVLRLLWIRTMADAGIALDDIRDAFADSPPAPSEGEVGEVGDEGDANVTDVLERLEDKLVAQEAELRRQRAAVARMRARGSRKGLLSDLVAARLDGLPEGSLRPGDLDSLLITERVFGPLGAAVQATRFIALATHPGLREHEDRVEVAEATLDDTVAVDDPRVAQVAAQRHAFERALHAVIEESGLAQEDDALFDTWDELHPAAPQEAGDEAGSCDRDRRTMSAFEAVARMPYDFSPARLRCMELVDELDALAAPTS